MGSTTHSAAFRKLSFTIVALALCPLLLTSCRKKSTRIPTPVPAAAPSEETGIASWYGHPYHGRRTANGEVYDMELFTAAHRTRIFDTWVRVHNLDNGKRVEVRINDRGPFVGKRIIDLSRAAARTIDMLGPGTALVRVESISPPRSVPAPTAANVDSAEELETAEPVVFAVQVGAFSDLDNAERLRGEMESRYSQARLMVRDGATQIWRVVVGELSDRAAAEDLAASIRAEHGPAFVVRLDPEDEGNSQSEPEYPPLDSPETP